MKLPWLVLAVLTAALISPAGFAANSAPAAKPSLSQPTLSPDASKIAFVANSAIWVVPATGGAAHLLVADGGNDSRPLYSPQGDKLAFVSDVTGNGDVYLLDTASGKLTRMTLDDGPDHLSGWSHDGKWLYFSSGRGNVGGMQGVFRVRASGGTPMPVSVEAYRNQAQAVPAPDNQQIALVDGMGDWQWWRHGRAHIDESAIWLLRNDGSHNYQRLTPDNARAGWPMWAADGKSLYYMSDRSGTENLWHVQLDGTQSALTQFTDGRLLWPTISANGTTIAFGRDFGIWTADTASGQSRAIPITLAGAVRGPSVVHKTFSKDFSDLRVSPDGKKLAFVVHGEVFATDAAEGGDADRVTHTAGAEYGIAWAPDSRHIVYGSTRSGASHLYQYDFRSAKETALTSGAGEDTNAVFAPDGKSLAFLRNAKELCVLDLANKRVRVIARGSIALKRPLQDDRALAWSPDGKWIAYAAWGERMFRNARAVRVSDGHDVALSFLANTFTGNVNWADDGKALLFTTAQRTKQGQVARVDLIPRTPSFHEDQFHDLFKEATPDTPEHGSDKGKSGKADAKADADKPPSPVHVDDDGIRERLSLLPIGLNVQAARVSPDGKTLLINAEVAGKSNLYVWSLDPLAKKTPVARQLTSSSGDKTDASFSADSKKVFYLDSGHIASVAVKSGSKTKPLNVKASMDVDFASEKMVVFNQAWSWLRDNFHDPDMHGVDWNAIHAEYAPRIAGAMTPAEMRRLLNLMVGELDASHSGVRSPDRPEFYSGQLGLHFDATAYEKHGKLTIASIVPLSPADVSGKIHIGDSLLAINGQTINNHANLARLLAHTTGKKTRLQIASKRGAHDVEVKPISAHAEADLAYAAWVQSNRTYVERTSHGRLGYVHLRDMSMASLNRFYKNLDAQNSTRDGVVIDVRNNFGGFVNAYVLDVLSRRPYLHMQFRGFDKAQPARTILGQRALERPTVLVTNRVTLSDGEDFAEGYRALKLGTTVGEPTAGWIIFTSNVPMIDGSLVRLPFSTITDINGKPMELHPRPVDVHVSRGLGESFRHIDSQLDTAVSTLLQQLGSGK